VIKIILGYENVILIKISEVTSNVILLLFKSNLTNADRTQFYKVT